MEWAKSRPFWVVVLGCWVMSAGAGCHQFPKQGFMVEGNWSLQCQQLTGPQCGEGYCEQPCSAGPDCGPRAAIEVEEPVAARRRGPASSDCESCAAIEVAEPVAARRRGPASPDCESCDAIEVEEPVAVRHRRRPVARGIWRFPIVHFLHMGPTPTLVKVVDPPHSPFHPVPTRPVFSPRTDLASSVPCSARSTQCTPMPPDAGPQPPEGPGPAPVPEEIITPPAEPPEYSDRTAKAPRRLEGRPPGQSWIFRPPTHRRPEAEITAKSRSEARWIKR